MGLPVSRGIYLARLIEDAGLVLYGLAVRVFVDFIHGQGSIPLLMVIFVVEGRGMDEKNIHRCIFHFSQASGNKVGLVFQGRQRGPVSSIGVIGSLLLMDDILRSRTRCQYGKQKQDPKSIHAAKVKGIRSKERKA